MSNLSLHRRAGVGPAPQPAVGNPGATAAQNELKGLNDRPGEHEHRLTHAVAVACEACAALLASMVASGHRESWELAVEQYDRTHTASSDRPPQQAKGTTP